MQKAIKSSVLTGIFIAVAGYIYLTVSGIVGSCVFAFGLLSLVSLSSYCVDSTIVSWIVFITLCICSMVVILRQHCLSHIY